MRLSTATLSILAISLLLSACTPSTPDTAEQDSATQADAVVTIGSERLGLADIKAEIEKLPPQHRNRLTNPRALRDFVDNQATRSAMMQEAREMGLADDPEILRQVEDYRERLVMQKLMADMRDVEFEPTEEELRVYFDARQAQFRRDGEDRSFDEAREDVSRRLRLQMQRDRHRTFVDEVREKRGVEVNDEVLAALRAALESELAQGDASAQ